VETIRLELEPGTVGLSLKLRLAERWPSLYSSSRRPFVVTTGNDEGREVVKADLGNHRVADLPLCTTDFLDLKRSDPSQCVLVDLDEDPEQRRNLVHTRPEVFTRLHGHLAALLASSDSWSQRDKAAEVELSEETIEQLRTLGYLD
jgi:hypothetical protein